MLGRRRLPGRRLPDAAMRYRLSMRVKTLSAAALRELQHQYVSISETDVFSDVDNPHVQYTLTSTSDVVLNARLASELVKEGTCEGFAMILGDDGLGATAIEFCGRPLSDLVLGAEMVKCAALQVTAAMLAAVRAYSDSFYHGNLTLDNACATALDRATDFCDDAVVCEYYVRITNFGSKPQTSYAHGGMMNLVLSQLTEARRFAVAEVVSFLLQFPDHVPSLAMTRIRGWFHQSSYQPETSEEMLTQIYNELVFSYADWTAAGFHADADALLLGALEERDWPRYQQAIRDAQETDLRRAAAHAAAAAVDTAAADTDAYAHERWRADLARMATEASAGVGAAPLGGGRRRRSFKSRRSRRSRKTHKSRQSRKSRKSRRSRRSRRRS